MKPVERAIAAGILAFAAMGSLVTENSKMRRAGVVCAVFAFLLIGSLPKNNVLPFRRPPKDKPK